MEHNDIYHVAWSAIFASISGSWQYGYSVGSINAAGPAIQNAIREDYEVRWNTTVSNDTVTGIWVASSAAFPAGGVFGCLLVGFVARNFGTLNALTLGHAITLVFALVMALSYYAHAPELLIIGRFGIGITSALVATGFTVMYTIEISPQRSRGKFGSLISPGIGFSIVMSNVLGLPQVLGGPGLWPILLALTGAPSLLFLVLRKTFIIKPRQNNKPSREQAPLNEFENPPSTERATQRMTAKQVLMSKKVRWPLICGVFICAAQQLTGLNGVSFNMNQIYEKAGISPEIVPYITIGVFCVIVLLNVMAASVTDKYGRKRLLTVGYSIESISLLLLVISMETQHLSEIMPYISIIAALGFLVGFSAGPGPTTFLIVAEFFEESARPAGVAIATVVLWITFVIAVIATPYMLEAISGFAFLPFSIFAIISVIFIHFRVPETKNKTFEEIQQAFQQKSDKARAK